MRIRSMTVLVAALASLAPVGARADHCAAPIYLFTSTKMPAGPHEGAVVVTSAAHCTAVNEDLGNQDVIYPGGNYWQVRWIVNEELPPTGTVTFAGATYDLTFTKGINFLLQPDQPWWDSQWFTVPIEATVTGGIADVNVCVIDPETETEYCQSRPYRTLP